VDVEEPPNAETPEGASDRLPKADVDDVEGPAPNVDPVVPVEVPTKSAENLLCLTA
jgi:hypothetical protein